MQKKAIDDYAHLQNKSFLKVSSIQTKSDRWDHEHCQICWKKSSVFNPVVGYYTLDKYYWICKECFDEYKSELNLRTLTTPMVYADIIDMVDREIGDANSRDWYRIERIGELVQSLDGIQIIFSSSIDVIVMPALVHIYPNPRISPEVNIIEKEQYIVRNNSLSDLCDALCFCNLYLNRLCENDQSFYVCIKKI